MSIGDFIFSEKKNDHIKRHIVFWIFWWLYYGILNALTTEYTQTSFIYNIPIAMLQMLLSLVPNIFLTYSLLLFVLPHFVVKGRYLIAILCAIVSLILSVLISVFVFKEVAPGVIFYFFPDWLQSNPKRSYYFLIFFAFWNSSFKSGVSVAGFAVGIKFMKFWYLKEQRNLQLQKENTQAQLQLLTGQVHPHFLFNTLNNIYSQTQTESPKGSKMIMELADMLRYILYAGSKPLAPLEMEIKMISEYFSLEKIRYGNKLEIHFEEPENTDGVYIAPLLLLPFIENCFKHGASNMLDAPWINLVIELNNSTLVMKLMNGKAAVSFVKPKKAGIGINNVKQRLELLYRDKYEIQITDEPEVFIVNLKVALVKIEEPDAASSKSLTDFVNVR